MKPQIKLDIDTILMVYQKKNNNFCGNFKIEVKLNQLKKIGERNNIDFAKLMSYQPNFHFIGYYYDKKPFEVFLFAEKNFNHQNVSELLLDLVREEGKYPEEKIANYLKKETIFLDATKIIKKINFGYGLIFKAIDIKKCRKRFFVIIVPNEMKIWLIRH